MVHKTIKFLLFLGAFFISSCYYDIEEELYPSTSCNTAGISYINDILPIIEANCYACHTKGSIISSINLEGYEKLKIAANNGSLIGSIRYQNGYTPMPQSGGVLSDCNIKKIEAWITNGIKNN